MQSVKVKTLHSMTDELLDLLGEISEAEGVLTEEQEQRLDSVRMNRKEKINRLLNFIEYEEGLARGLSDEIKSRQRLKKIRENTVKGLKNYLLRELRRSGDRSIETAEHRIRRQKNAKAQINRTRCEVDERFYTEIPAQWEFSPEKTRKWLQDHGRMPGEVGRHILEDLGIDIHVGEHIRYL